MLVILCHCATECATEKFSGTAYNTIQLRVVEFLCHCATEITKTKKMLIIEDKSMLVRYNTRIRVFSGFFVAQWHRFAETHAHRGL